MMKIKNATKSRDEIEAQRRELNAQLAALERQEREDERRTLEERRNEWRDGAAARKEKRAQLKADLEEARRLRDEPEMRVRRAETALAEFEGNEMCECKKLGTCPGCNQGDFNHRNLIAVCPLCGYRNLRDSPQSFTPQPAMSPTPVGVQLSDETSTLTARQFAKRLQVSIDTLRTYVREGRVPQPAGLSRGKWIFSAGTIHDWEREGMPRLGPPVALLEENE